MAISQISTSNTFQQWLTSTQLLIDHANYFQETSNLIFETANNVSNINTEIQNYVSVAFDTANTVNLIANIANTTANIANTTANIANTTANDANTTANIANTTAYNANVIATQVLSDLANGNIFLDVIDDTIRGTKLNIALFDVSNGLTPNVYASSSKLNFTPSTGALSTNQYQINGVTVIDSNRNLINLGSPLPVANGGTGATNSSNARINLGLSLGVNVQAYSATLDTVTAGTYTGTTSIITLGTISTGTWNANTISVNKGGTNITSYTTGDLIYASGTTTLAKLSDVAIGNTLISGGIGVAPSWGKIGLTTHVTGNLAVGNGGTGATTSSGARTNLGLVIGADIQAYSANLASFAAKIAPSGIVVGTTDTQTLNNKTMFSTTLSGTTLNDGYTEEVYSISGTTPALSPTNGSIQTWTLTADSTPTSGTWNSGQSMTLLINDGTSNTVNWSSLAVSWKTGGGAPPSLNLTGFTVIALWKVSTTIYGARVGDA